MGTSCSMVTYSAVPTSETATVHQMPKCVREQDLSPRADALGNPAEEVELGEVGQVQSVSKAQEDESSPTIVFAVLLYAACSSTLLVINKVSMHLVPDAAFVLLCQFIASGLACRILLLAKPDVDIELLTMEKVKPFVGAVFVFFLCLLANTKALGSVNVETVIVVRSCSPIAVALLDHVTLGKELPSAKGSLALLGIVGGALVYVVTDEGFRVEGYAWLAAYFVFIVVEMVFVKFIVDTVEMSTWTRVYYNNMLSIPMAFSTYVISGKAEFLQVDWNLMKVMALGCSCIVGVAISYAGFNLRKQVSATSFTVVGVVCKVVTVLINDLIWSQHSGGFGHLGLAMCIAAGFLYERAKAEQRAQSGK